VPSRTQAIWVNTSFAVRRGLHTQA